MTTELTYLAYTALLTALLWIPYIIGLASNHPKPMPERFADPTLPELPNWAKRANRAHINAVETLAPFAVFVLILAVTGQFNAMTAFWTMLFFWARVAHAVIYWTGIPYLRTLAFLVGLIATIGLFWEVVN
ncbi:MAPEG family protein [Sphingorhabdus sp. Alg239-R122]|uniref:MAPEG family protein n=1 Tax=Sphingorhabdus sp. Alg239-R122 TaxID=2305989 RepID=UPI0013DBDBE7|nr:MAPEG family protein [Sphingorhabdus sp. Alg239-R122]